jgi:hypothetical protein
MLLVLLAACGGGSSASSMKAPAPDDVCASGLCVAKDDAARLAAVKDAYAGCAPVAGDGQGSVKISAVAVAANQGSRVIVRVTLANPSPNASTSSPGMRLRIESGAAELGDPGDGRLAGPEFDRGTLDSLAACTEQTFDFAVEWDGQAAVYLSATATDDNGAAVADQLAFRLQP